MLVSAETQADPLGYQCQMWQTCDCGSEGENAEQRSPAAFKLPMSSSSILLKSPEYALNTPLNNAFVNYIRNIVSADFKGGQPSKRN